MKTIISLLLEMKTRTFIFVISSFLIMPSVKADTYYNSSHISIINTEKGLFDGSMRTYLEFKILAMDYDGTDDELDDVNLYYLHPVTHEWVLFFHGDCDNNDTWEAFGETDYNVSQFISGMTSEGDLRYGHMKFYPPEGMFSNTILFKAALDWDIDEDDSNLGIDNTFYYQYKATSDIFPSKKWEEFATYTYDENDDVKNEDNDLISFQFLMAEMYGYDKEGCDAIDIRNELDDVILEYDDDGTWKTILHGDCDNSLIDVEYQSFYKTTDGAVGVTTENVGSRYFANVSWRISPSVLGRNIKFRYAYKWDEGADQINTDPTQYYEFTVQTYTDKYTASKATLIENLENDYPQVKYTWNIPNARSVDHFEVRRRTTGVTGDVTVANMSEFDRDATSFSFVNAADASNDESTDNQYLLEDGRQYLYWVYTKYIGDNSTNSNYAYKEDDDDDWGRQLSSIIDLKPTVSSFSASSNSDDNVIIIWGNTARTNNIKLYRKSDNGNYSKLELTSDDLALSQYVDANVSGCVDYTYKLELESFELNSQTYSNSRSVGVIVNTDLSNSITDLEVSKGYYDDRVLLEWRNNGGDGLQNIKVLRKELGAEEFSTLAVLSTDANTYVDESASSGIYYEYEVFAEGICGSSGKLSFSQINNSIGFCQRAGIISGQITYDGGTAVEGVRVALERSSNTDVASGTSIASGQGQSLVVDNVAFANSFASGFTVEAWFKLDETLDFNELFSCAQSGGKGFKLYQSSDDEKRFTLEMGDTLNVFIIPDSAYAKIKSTSMGFNHYALSYSDGHVSIYCNSIEVFREDLVYLNTIDEPLKIAQHYDGIVDEIRVWSVPCSQETIEASFTRLLSGKEDDLKLYWRLDEGQGDDVYDFSNQKGVYNKQHGSIVNATWSKVIPVRDYLALCGLSNADGYYIIDGIHYQGIGETFKVTPMLDVHEFSPKNRTMFIGNSSLTQNDKNFDDVSSFKVTGTIYYEGTNYPVSDVYIKVDGMYVQGEGGKPVATDETGYYEVDVPIGEHYIEVEKREHEFVTAFFPEKNNDGKILLNNFEGPYDRINFYDKTKVKVIGKVVGGAVEAAKQTGSKAYPAVNNIGQASITLTSSGRQYNLPNGSLDTTFFTDVETGNYEIDLLPEVYRPVDAASVVVKKGEVVMYSFNSDADVASLDLRNAFQDQEVIDSIFTNDSHGYAQFDSIDTACVYNYERNWVCRTAPQLKVTNLEGGALFGLTHLPYTNAEGGSDLVEIARESSGTAVYDLGHPVFSMGNMYGYQISAFESYTNVDNDKISEVPVTDGKVAILNNCASGQKEEILEFDQDGKVDYTFGAGMPNSASPFLLSTDIKLIIGSTSYQWDKAPLECYVLGAVPTGSNFVTQGPDEIDFILRDPAGSNSYAFLEKGSSVSNNVTSSITASSSAGTSASLNLGVDIGVHVGTPFFHFQTNVEIENTTTIGLELTSTSSGECSYESSVSYSKSYSTSEAADYVGAMGDIFFGKSTNIIYGLANSLELMKPDEVLDDSTIIKTISIDNTDYVLAQKQALRFSPEVNTTFVYTQNHIEESLIPNLILLRNLFYASHTSQYTLVEQDQSDDKFLSNNDDVSVWGSEAVSNDDRFNGPSYTFIPSQDNEGNDLWESDTVRYYNKQIRLWQTHLANNEKQKLNAEPYPDTEFPSNISFDAGAGFEASVTTSKTEALSASYEIELASSFSNNTGVTVSRTGATFEISTSASLATSLASGKEVAKETTVGFVLADEDAGDYFSIDVLKCKKGNGPVFRTRGGQSSCPYEGAEETKYYKPGTIVSEATMQIEQPHIRVDENLVMGVSEDAAAFFTIELSNTSETGDDGWYNLIVEPASNPYGAEVKLDGAAMSGNGKQILIPAGQTVYKTISITKGRTDIDEYDDIKLILHSQCQYDPTDFVDDIADEVTVSAHFVPACSPIKLLAPLANWVVNKEDDDKMNVTLGGYNLQHEKMQAIAFQYKAKSASTWITDKWWVNNPDMVNKDAIEDTLFINDLSSVSYQWDLSPLSDREYEIRAISYCDNEVNSYSQVLIGMLDGKEPKLFGTPEPADGILSTGENMAIYFDEAIEAGLVNSSNITVSGVLNGYETNHDVSIQLDGAASTVESAEGLQLAHRSFTLEFWLKISDFNQDGNILSYGYTGTNGLALMMKDGKMSVSMNGVSATFACNTNTTWHHYAISYNANEEKLDLIQDDGNVIQGNFMTLSEVESIEENSTLTIGANSINNAFEGNVHDLRVWSRALSAADVYANMYTILNGKEMGLMSYWRMDEAFGSLIEDKASARHAVMDGATWMVNPTGKSYQFNGSNALLADISAIPVTADGNMTIELWMKAGAAAKNSTLFSNGTPSTAEASDLSNILSFDINAEGVLEVSSNGELLASDGELTDEIWHHIALVVKRTGNAILYVDGNQESSVYGSSFGNFGGSKLAIGALKDNMTDATSHYFTGQLDEIRIWHSARPQEVLASYRNARVGSRDLGLRAYFPFETYTKNVFDFYESTTSIVDQSYSIYDKASYCGSCVVVGNELFSDLTPNIKRDRELSAVNCDITVNVDKIVITPTDPDSKLENCVLEISVDGIYDKYGNKMASAATWTAYVDQNTVTWTEDEIELSKDVNGEITFSTYVRNAGGTYESYSIENLPSWLEASPSAGIIAPDGDKKIAFTVRSGLNVGTFNEDLYLKTDFGFDERMNIALRVNGEAPDWTVSAGDMSETMSFVGRVKIKDQVSKDVFDKVAVFAGDDCRGVANVTYFSEIDEYLLMLTVYGDMDGEELSYSVYDAGSGETFTSCSVDSTFVAQMVYGSVVNPVVFDWDNLVKNNIPLQNGWNWISFNASLDHYNDLNEVMANVEATNGDRIKSVSEGKVSQFYSYNDISQWVGTVDKPSNDVMYQCYIQKGGNLVYEGVNISPKEFDIQVQSGWNRISYIPSINLGINEALSAYDAQAEDVIKSQLGFAIYTGFSWIGSLEYMERGKGYMLKRAETVGNTSFKYPSASTFVSAKSTAVDNAYDVFGLDPYAFESSTSILAQVNGLDNAEGSYLLAYVNGSLRGVTPISDETMFVTVFGNEVDLTNEISFKIEALSGILETSALAVFNSSSIVGTIDHPFVIDFVPTGFDASFSMAESLNVYPNPFSDVVNVELVLQKAAEVSIEVFNALGQCVYTTPIAQCASGKNTLEWNASALSEGVYSVVVSIDDKRQVVKLSKVKL